MGANRESKNTSLIIRGAIVLLLAGLALWGPWRSPAQAENAPPFSTVVPKNTTIEKLGGWQQLTPPDGTPVYVYTDTVNGVPVSVSQQALPATFKSDRQAKLTEVAKGYNATTQLIAGDVKAYIGTSARGPQSVLFIKENVLVLIKSRENIPTESWIAYIELLN